MFRIARSVRGLLLVHLLIGCTDVNAPDLERPVFSPPAHRSLIDGANGGSSGFYFLPPMVRQPQSTGAFDASISPVVEICALSGSACETSIATFTRTTGPSGETVRVNESDELYAINWHTNLFTLDRTRTYRVIVRVSGTELGHADVVLVSNGAKHAVTGDLIALVDGRTLPIKFRIETGAVGIVTPSEGGTATLAGSSVVIEFPAGAVEGEIAVTATPVAVGIDGTDSSVLPGTRFDFQPSPAEFAEPVTLALQYPAVLPPLVKVERLAVCKMTDGACVPLRGSRVDPVTRTVTAQISSFSEYGITEWPEVLFGFTHLPGVSGITLWNADGEVFFPEANHVSWAPDGSRFASIWEPGGWNDPMVINIHNVATHSRTTILQGDSYRSLTWSPAGDQIAFIKNPLGMVPGVDAELMVINEDGTGLRTLSSNVTNAWPYLAWSPDGSRIAFAGVLNGTDCICVINLDGTGLEVVVSNAVAEDPVDSKYAIDWSANGAQIAFFGTARIEDDHLRGLHIVNSDGSGLRYLVPGVASGDYVSGFEWSPTDPTVLVITRASDSGYVCCELGLYTLRSDGTEARKLVDGDVYRPSWSPDGQKISFSGSVQDWGPWGSWFLNSDGTGLWLFYEPLGDRVFWRP